jgi:chemotaxis protein CheC
MKGNNIMKPFQKDNQLNPDVADALYELSNVGIGKATTALSKMIDERITIQTPVIMPTKTDIRKLVKSYHGKLSMGIVMRLGENLGGVVLVLIDQKFMKDLVNKLTGTQYTDEQMLKNEESLSAIKEVANIMAASYMTAISSYTGLRIYLTPVMVGVDIVDALIAYPIEKMYVNPKNCICINTSFMVQGKETKNTFTCQGNIVIFPDDSSLQVLVDSMM